MPGGLWSGRGLGRRAFAAADDRLGGHAGTAQDRQPRPRPRGGPAAGGRRTAAVADRQPGPGHRVQLRSPLRPGSLPGRRRRVLRPGGQLFIYTRTPQQNARTIWGRCFPGFTEHEQRLHSQAALRDAVRRTGGLTMIATQTFRHPRTSTAGRLGAQARGRHYSTFSLYTPQELRAAIAAFLARLPGPEVCWVDQHLLVLAARSRHHQAEPDGPASLPDQPVKDQAPPAQRRPRRRGSLPASRRPRADHPVMRPADCRRRPSAERPDRRMCALSSIFSVAQRDAIGGFSLSQLAQGRGPKLRCLTQEGWPSPARCIAR